MTGSRRYFGYVTDDGITLAIDQDESNAESAVLGFVAIPAAIAGRPELRMRSSAKFPIEPRYIRAERTDADGKTQRRKFQVGSTGPATAWANGTVAVNISGQAWTITAKVGEVRHYIPAKDTGLIDGDVDANIAAGPVAP